MRRPPPTGAPLRAATRHKPRIWLPAPHSELPETFPAAPRTARNLEPWMAIPPAHGCAGNCRYAFSQVASARMDAGQYASDCPERAAGGLSLARGPERFMAHGARA